MLLGVHEEELPHPTQLLMIFLLSIHSTKKKNSPVLDAPTAVLVGVQLLLLYHLCINLYLQKLPLEVWWRMVIID